MNHPAAQGHRKSDREVFHETSDGTQRHFARPQRQVGRHDKTSLFEGQCGAERSVQPVDGRRLDSA